MTRPAQDSIGGILALRTMIILRSIRRQRQHDAPQIFMRSAQHEAPAS
jgi:hypothetical protein